MQVQHFQTVNFSLRLLHNADYVANIKIKKGNLIMYFNISGKMDISKMLSAQGGRIDSQKFCEQILNNNLQIKGYKTCAEIEEYEKYYKEMHPKMRLCEDIVKMELSDEEIKQLFKKFFRPICADVCPVTIIDPYFFKSPPFIYDVIEENIKSQKLRIIYNSQYNENSQVNDFIANIKSKGFTVDIVDSHISHDRYWFTRVSGFTTGTSPNGIGKKISTFSMLSQKDLHAIISIFGI